MPPLRGNSPEKIGLGGAFDSPEQKQETCYGLGDTLQASAETRFSRSGGTAGSRFSDNEKAFSPFFRIRDALHQRISGQMAGTGIRQPGTEESGEAASHRLHHAHDIESKRNRSQDQGTAGQQRKREGSS
jgi:hypothetical protein